MAPPEAAARADRVQSTALRIGAGLDAAFGFAMLFAARPAAALLSIELPQDPTWFRLAAVLLLILSGVYLALAVAPARVMHAPAAWAGAGRLVGAGVLAAAFLDGRGAVFAGVAACDLALGLIHLGAAWTARRAP